MDFLPQSEGPTMQAGDPLGMRLSDERQGEQGAWAPRLPPTHPQLGYSLPETQPSPSSTGCPHQAKFICPNDLTRRLRAESWRVS